MSQLIQRMFFSYEADYGYDDYREGGRDSGYSAPGQDYSGDHSHGYNRQDSGYSHNQESVLETDRFLDQVKSNKHLFSFICLFIC